MPSRRWVRPLAETPWRDTLDPDLPGHLRRLGGEFFCLPFGGGGAVRQALPGWERLADGCVDVAMHGPSANADWRVTDHRKDQVTLALEYPEAFPVRCIERTIAFAPDRPRVDITVRVEARRTARVPAAFHPILRLPDAQESLEIDADFALGWTYPGIVEPDCMACEPGQQFESLADVPRRHGGRIDLHRLPLGPPTEDVVLMAGMRGPVRATFSGEGFVLDIDWSRQPLPHCMMWMHDRGSDAKPWAGRYRGLGLEPMAAAFDGPWSLSAGANPLNAAGYATSVLIRPDAPTKLTCTLAVSQI